MRTLALIPAAGKSARMGRPKLALSLGERTVLERVLETLRAAGIADILVVLGPHVAQLEPLAENAGANVLLLAHESPDMRATIGHGLDWLEARYHPAGDDAFLLLPADHPALDADVIRALEGARLASPETASIWIPTHEGRRGHPALIAWRHVPAIRALPPTQGLNVFLRAHAGETLEVPCRSADILCDLDTPADYERLLMRFAGEHHETG